ncbi:MAG: translation initiation factor IF-2 [Chlamydiae bacterium]|nr:MAG: translation initiation factor IF-2 [Chlamydiota bacterium]
MHLFELAEQLKISKSDLKKFLKEKGYIYKSDMASVALAGETAALKELPPIIEAKKAEKAKKAAAKREEQKKKKAAEKKKKAAEKKKIDAIRKKKEKENKKNDQARKLAEKEAAKIKNEEEKARKLAEKEAAKIKKKEEEKARILAEKEAAKKKITEQKAKELAKKKADKKKQEDRAKELAEKQIARTKKKEEKEKEVENRAHKKNTKLGKTSVPHKKNDVAKPAKKIEKVPLNRINKNGPGAKDILTSFEQARKTTLTKRSRPKTHYAGVKNTEAKINQPRTSEFASKRQQMRGTEGSQIKRGGPARPFKRHKSHKSTSEKPLQQKSTINVQIPISVRDFSQATGIKVGDIIGFLMKSGIMASINQVIGEETVIDIAEKFNLDIATSKETNLEQFAFANNKITENSNLEYTMRMPIVTFMGHVDHGKTSLLDAIRQTDIVSGESGGITQHIGASEVPFNNGWITFIDTPGHEAFTSMRARGANVTDIAVLVVAADDGLMPQSLEAIDHARAANVPIIVAVNKIDLAGANPDRVLRQLAERNLTPEDWGGETICCNVSAITKEGLDNLLEMISLQAEILELKAQEAALAEGVVIEADVDPGQGATVTVLVENGTLKKGDPIVCDAYYAKARALINTKGELVDEAGPSRAVQVLGFSQVPTPGTKFRVATNEKHAKELVEKRQIEQKQKEHAEAKKISLENFYRRMSQEDIKELSMIIKADTQGTTEAVRSAIERLSTNKVKVSIISCSVSDVNDNDVMLAAASQAVILAFKVGASASAQSLAAGEGVEIKKYDVIYHATDEIKLALLGLLEPVYKEITTGTAEIRQVFKLSSGIVAGCYITSGVIERSNKAKLYRADGELIFEGDIQSLKHLKDEVKDVRAGMECGIILKNCTDYREGDRIETYKLEQQTPQL